MKNFSNSFDQAFEQVIQSGNHMAADHPDADLWEIADGLLAGAVQFWLFSRQPCGDVHCQDCAAISTADLRVAEMIRSIRQYSEESEYYHSPNDTNAGRA